MPARKRRAARELSTASPARRRGSQMTVLRSAQRFPHQNWQFGCARDVATLGEDEIRLWFHSVAGWQCSSAWFSHDGRAAMKGGSLTSKECRSATAHGTASTPTLGSAPWWSGSLPAARRNGPGHGISSAPKRQMVAVQQREPRHPRTPRQIFTRRSPGRPVCSDVDPQFKLTGEVWATKSGRGRWLPPPWRNRSCITMPTCAEPSNRINAKTLVENTRNQRAGIRQRQPDPARSRSHRRCSSDDRDHERFQHRP